MVSAVICDKCKYGHCLPKVTTDNDSDWICDHCEEITSSDTISQKVNFIRCLQTHYCDLFGLF
jgi:hypothetical protein